MATNFVRRRIYTTGTPNPAAANIDGYVTLPRPWMNIPWPNLSWNDTWKLVVDELVDAAAATTGFWNAWGSGEDDWDDIPDDDTTGDTALTTPLGIFPGVLTYITPDVAGTIRMSDMTRWNVSMSQTPYMLIESPYAAGDEPTAAIRELGLYIGATAPAGPYVEIADVTDIGELRAIDRIRIVGRSPVTSGKVRFLVSVENNE